MSSSPDIKPRVLPGSSHSNRKLRREEKVNSTKRLRILDDGSSISVDSNIGKVLSSIEFGKFASNWSFNIGVVSILLPDTGLNMGCAPDEDEGFIAKRGRHGPSSNMDC
ncbi:hypothetical protein Tco_0496247 [Tanacetum coccineum]